MPGVLKHYDKNVFDIEENYINVSIPYDAEVMVSMHVTDVGPEHDTENRVSQFLELLKNQIKLNVLALIKVVIGKS